MWRLIDNKGSLVEPIVYTTGRSQAEISEDAVEVLDKSEIVSLIGGVGSGKSAIALHVVEHYDSGIIVVPTKILQNQYVDSYCKGKKFHLKRDNGEKFEVIFMFGRNNFVCPHTRKNCSDKTLPCTKNLEKDESRLSVASKCPHWSPIYPERFSFAVDEVLTKHKKMKYLSVGGLRYFYKAPIPCPYYAQFEAYTRDCCIIMNLAKFEAETWIMRKPDVPVEIVDEGDSFLDGLAYRTSITKRLLKAIEKEGLVSPIVLRSMERNFSALLKKFDNYDNYFNSEILNFLEMFQTVLADENNSQIAEDVVSRLKLICQYKSISWARIHDKSLTVFIPRPDITLSEIRKRCGKILLMSATMQKPHVLSSVFGIEPANIVAEPRFAGTIYIKFAPEELSVTYKNWSEFGFQQKYFDLLLKMIEHAKRPTLVQVHAKKYVPQEYEHLLNKGFINGVSWSTVSDRGVDLPDDECRSIVLTKFPLPDTSDVVFKVMERNFGQAKFWSYVNDIADRDLVQMVGRGVRSMQDWVEVWSPDRICLTNLQRLWQGNKMLERVEWQ